MDWRHNQWVGVGAAVLLVLGIVGIFLYLGGGGSLPEGAVDAGLTFQCEATGQTFRIRGKDLEDQDTYLTYFNRPDEALKCQIDDQDDAYWVYWCEECQKYYRVTRILANSDSPFCPEGHRVTIWMAPK